jgi:hypothetical protein
VGASSKNRYDKTKTVDYQDICIAGSGDALKQGIALSQKRRKRFVGLWSYPVDLTEKTANA